MKYSLIKDGEDSSITVYLDGRVLQASNTHPNFDKIVEDVIAGDVEVSLFDPAVDIADRFERLSDRVSVAGGHIYFDGDLQDDSLTKQILRFMQEKSDFKPLVNFMEKIAQNPQAHSREQLFSWLQNNNFTIDEDGDIVAYKGVNVDTDSPGVFLSTNSGTAIVNGKTITGYIPQMVHDVVEMPRSAVTHDPNNACAAGLHCSGWDYARSYGTKRLQVKVSPRDIVSVPTHDSFQKVRACRYKVIAVVDNPVESALLRAPKPEPVTISRPVLAPKAAKPVETRRVKPTPSNYGEWSAKALRDAAQRRQIRVEGRRPSHCSRAELEKALKAADRKAARKSSK